MEKKDKSMLIVISGAFLSVIAFILFFTFQTKEKLIENTGRYNEVILGDVTCDNGQYLEGGTCHTCEPGYYCPDKEHKYMCTGNTVAANSGMTACVECSTLNSNYPYAYSLHTRCYNCDGGTYDENVNHWCELGFGYDHCTSETGNPPLCYYDPSTNTYVWSSTSPGGTYEVITTVTSEYECSESVCWYNSSTGDYKWQIGNPGTGYVQVPEKNRRSLCGDPKCWYNRWTHEYKWQIEWPPTEDGQGVYNPVDTITTETTCSSCWKKQGSNGYEYRTSPLKPADGWTWVGNVGEVTCSETPACYQNGSEYKWGNYNGMTGYTKVNGVTSVSDCKNFCWKKSSSIGNEYQESITSPGTGWTKVGEIGTVACGENQACYKNGNEYKWGSYDGVTGYTKVNGVTSVSDCKNFCWKKSNGTGNEYQESVTSPGTGWTKVGEIGKVVCGENVACYQNGNEYKWGNYDGVAGYTKVNGVTEQSKCAPPKCYYNPNTDDYKWDVLPPSDEYHVVDVIDIETNCVKKEQDACYKNKTTGAYVWGKYEKDPAYELVKNTDKDDCHDVVDNVPKTDFGVSEIVYIATILLAVIGVSIISYTSYIRKHS